MCLQVWYSSIASLRSYDRRIHTHIRIKAWDSPSSMRMKAIEDRMMLDYIGEAGYVANRSDEFFHCLSSRYGKDWKILTHAVWLYRMILCFFWTSLWRMLQCQC